MKKCIHRYGYSSPTDGTYSIDGVSYSVNKDFRTIEKYQEYKDVGFDTLLLQGNDPYCGEDWLTSQLKKNMDNASIAGIKRIIVFDKRIYDLSRIDDGIIGKDKNFVNEEELDCFIKDCLKDYSKHPCFIGVMLVDEPRINKFLSISQLQKSLYRVMPDIYIHCNLLPYYGTIELETNNENDSLYQKYQYYIETYLSMCPQKVMMMDSYPYRYTNEKGNYLILTHYPGLQIFADMCKKYHRVCSFVLQSFTMKVRNEIRMRQMNYATLKHQYNIAIAFGVKEIGYFTYWRKQHNETLREFFPDGGAFINQDGTKTEVYNASRKIHQESEDIEDFLLNFNYEASTFLNCPEAIDCVNEPLREIEISSNDQILVTELKNEQGYCYCIINIADPDVCQTNALVDIDSKKDIVLVDKNKTNVGLKTNLSLKPGEIKVLFIKK